MTAEEQVKELERANKQVERARDEAMKRAALAEQKLRLLLDSMEGLPLSSMHEAVVAARRKVLDG